jgi:hypothetical protein
MKLSKGKLINSVKPKLKILDFTEFKDTGWQGIFSKKIDKGFYLTLGLTIHRYYGTAFTGDFYLSTNTCIGAQWGDIPYYWTFLVKLKYPVFLAFFKNVQ